MFQIVNVNNGLKSSDVMQCEDILQLERWLAEQGLDVTAIDVQLSNARIYKEKNGEYEDYKHYRKMITAHKLQMRLYSLIKQRLNVLYQERTDYNKTAVEVIKENMSAEQWNQIHEEINERLSRFSTS